MTYRKTLAAAVAMTWGIAAIASGQVTPTRDLSRPAATQPAESERPAGDGSMMLSRLQQLAGELSLTDNQKQQIAGDIDQARQDLSWQLQGMRPRQRMEKVRGELSDLRQKISDVLTDQQKSEFQQKLQALRQHLQADRTGLLQRMHNALGELDLTANQRSQIRDVFDDAREKLLAIREQADGDARQIRQHGQQLAEDVRTKLQSILTADQQQKLRALLGQPQRSTTRPARDRDARGASFEQRRETRQPVRNLSLEDDNVSPSVGQMAPDLTIRKVDGSSVQLSTYRGNVVVLESGSYSSPAFRERVAGMEELNHDLGALASFFVIYTKESHPAGDRELQRNKDQNISIEQPADLAARRRAAEQARAALGITIPMLMDDMENSAAKALGVEENSLIVIGRDGKVAARQNWTDPSGARRLIEQAIHMKTAASD